MKRLWPIMLSIVLFSCVSSHEQFSESSPADKRDSVDVAAYETRYGKHDGVFLIWTRVSNTPAHRKKEDLEQPHGLPLCVAQEVPRAQPGCREPDDLRSVHVFKFKDRNALPAGDSPNGQIASYGIKDLVRRTLPSTPSSTSSSIPKSSRAPSLKKDTN